MVSWASLGGIAVARWVGRQLRGALAAKENVWKKIRGASPTKKWGSADGNQAKETLSFSTASSLAPEAALKRTLSGG